MKIFNLILISSIFLLSFCSKDLCENSNCLNGGYCESQTGNCICTQGFEGNDCENLIDPCQNVVCYSNGICQDGICEYCTNNPDNFFEDELCTELCRDKFIGNTLFQETCTSGINSMLTVEFSEKSNDNDFMMDVESTIIQSSYIECSIIDCNNFKCQNIVWENFKTGDAGLILISGVYSNNKIEFNILKDIVGKFGNITLNDCSFIELD